VTSSPSETSEPTTDDATEDAAGASDPLAEYAQSVGAVVGSTDVSADFGTVKVRVERDAWIATLTNARDELGLVFFSWLSAVDWANDVAVGDAPDEAVDERYELLCAVSDLTEGKIVIFSTDLEKDDPVIDSLVEVYAGANWHEREAAEMFGISFRGHPNLENLYLPDAFEGHPLRKSYPLLSREVKPWPGKVDVEDMPSTENPEA
jgi:NADH-quinone oxidoreductase subunit C